MIHALYVAYCDGCGKPLQIEPTDTVDQLRAGFKRSGAVEIKHRSIRGWLRSETYCKNCKTKQKETTK